MSLIEARLLTKTYFVKERQEGFLGSIKGFFVRQTKAIPAVKQINFQIEPGELVAFLGPNGAGKTTTLKMLSGLLYPTGGDLKVMGFEPFKKQSEFLKLFSFVMGQKHQLWWELPALDTFRLNAAIYKLSQKEFEKRCDELHALLDLNPLWNVPVKKLSLGQRMKMELACSLIHEPQLLLLDEPTIGLDVVMQKTLRDFVREINQTKKTTILLTSHNMSDIESLCKRVIVIHHGIILFDGDLSTITNRFMQDKTVVADLLSPIDREMASKFGEVKNFSPVRIEWSVPRDQVARVVADVLKGTQVKDLTIEEAPLEDVIRKIFKDGAV
ncbi:MAG: ATP-binding cassette domain-containing protein [Elusimicrobiota bacterium]